MIKISLYSDLDYVDGITIINTEGIILFTVKFNPDVHNSIEETIVGKKLFNVFHNISKGNSSLFECIEKEKLIIRKNQLVKNSYIGDAITDNISLPIKQKGRVVGAIELSKSILENIDYIENNIQLENKKENKKESIKLKPECLDLGDTAKYKLEDIVCDCKEMKDLVNMANHIACSSSPVFIFGETGTGKELFAHGIHNASNRRNRPFIVQNCSAVPENLLESIFFGSVKGSYTGAVDKKGLFEASDGGTLFLDELHCMPIYLQAKLLRAIECGYIRRIGETKERKFDVRIIAATNINSKDIISKEYIRSDLYYRLAVVNINIPSLRERSEDILLLSDFFIKKYNKIFNKNIKYISQELKQFILTYSWPGNVRELENFLESSILYAQKEESVLKYNQKWSNQNYSLDKNKSLKDELENLEVKLIEEALWISGRNVTKAAEYLKIPRQTLQQKMIKFKIKRKL